MNVRQSFKRLLAALIAAGLAIAPLVTPAAAEHSMHAAMMQMTDMPDMAVDMPCCPDKQKSNDCQGCPLVAICLLQLLQAGPSAHTVVMRLPARVRLLALDDMVVDGLARPPPEHPPRHLV